MQCPMAPFLMDNIVRSAWSPGPLLSVCSGTRGRSLISRRERSPQSRRTRWRFVRMESWCRRRSQKFPLLTRLAVEVRNPTILTVWLLACLFVPGCVWYGRVICDGNVVKVGRRGDLYQGVLFVLCRTCTGGGSCPSVQGGKWQPMGGPGKKWPVIRDSNSKNATLN